MTTEIHGIEGLLRKLNRLKVMDPLRDMLTKAALIAQAEARANAPQDTRTLSRSIAIEINPLKARVFTPLNYAPVMEYGRRPGARMPPPPALAGWARRHGFAGSLFVLARAIARRGIKGRFFMQKAKQVTERALPRLLREMDKDIERQWRTP